MPRDPKNMILVFDVNETLLDLSALKPRFVKVFGNAGALDKWFDQVIQYAMGLTLAESYQPFGEIAAAAFQMVAAIEGVSISTEEAKGIIGGIRSLPPHAEVIESLTLLRSAGFRMVALTNSPMAVVDAQLGNAGMQPFFERNFSVDTVKRYKPAPEPYLMVARELGIAPAALRMIAAHAWDVGGAMQAGYRAAFISRPGKALYPLFATPDITGKNMRDVAEAIIRTDRPH